MAKVLFLILAAASLFFSPAIALFMGVIFALFMGTTPEPWAKKLSKYLLQGSVVAMGFGMNLFESLQSSKEGMIMTIVSVIGVMLLGAFIGRRLGIEAKITHLVSSGTAICGGSAIAAVSPAIGAKESETSIALAVIFLLNAVALFIFPPIGEWLGLTQQQFGLWAAIAIHDTSSVVGAAAQYGEEALMVATTVKLTRALWIIPLSLISIFIFRSKGKGKVSIPWFIFLYILAMVVNTYFAIPDAVGGVIEFGWRHALSLTLFLIGSELSIGAIKETGFRPITLALILWGVISIFALLVVI